MEPNARLRKTFPAGAVQYLPARAFTLVELLVVMGIIVILLSILLPAIQVARSAASRAATLSLIEGIEIAMGQYYSDFADLPEDGNIAMRTRLEQAGHRTFSSAEMQGEFVIDGFGNPLYYDEIAASGFNPWGGDAGQGEDPRGGSPRNARSCDLWSLGEDGKPGGENDLTNWR